MGNNLFFGSSPAFQSGWSLFLRLSSPSPVQLTSISSSSCCVAASRSLRIRSFHGTDRARAERQERDREVTHAGQELLRGHSCCASTRRGRAETQHEHWDWGRRSWNSALALLLPAEGTGTERDHLGATGERREQVSPRSSAGTILGQVRRAAVPSSISYTKGEKELAHCWKRHLDGAQTGQARREWKNKSTEHRLAGL